MGQFLQGGKNGRLMSFSLGSFYRMGRVYKWKWSMYVWMSVITSKMIENTVLRRH